MWRKNKFVLQMPAESASAGAPAGEEIVTEGEVTQDSTPPSAPATAEAPEDAVPEDMWAALNKDEDEALEDEDDLSNPYTEAEEEKPASSDAHEEQPTEAQPPAQDETPPVEEVSQPEQPQTPPVSQAQEPQQPTQEQLAAWQAKVAEARQTAVNNLAQEFTLSEEEADLVITAPEKVMPKLAANLFLKTYEAVMQGVQKQMPVYMANTMKVQEESTRLEQGFYEQWSALDKEQHGQLVDRFGMMYLQVNPNATREDFIRDVGAQALVALGIPFQVNSNAPQEKMPLPVPPTAPVGRPTAPPSGSMNQFERLAMDFEDEDL